MDSAIFIIIDEIEPLEFDSTLTNDFISKLVKEKIDKSLIEHTDALYEEINLKNLKERKILVDLLGNRNLFFDGDY